MKHFTQTLDFTAKEYNEIFRRAKLFQDKPTKKHAELCRGKILAVMFMQESTRTLASNQAAILRLGGGWLGMTSAKGSYVESGEESMEDTLLSIAEYADIMAVRDKKFDLSAFAAKSPIPLMNAMCGGDEHTQGGLAYAYTIYRRRGSLKDLTIGIYGMTKSSRPTKALLKALSLFGATFYEDSVVAGLQTPADIKKIVEHNGSKIITSKLDDFIDKIDFLFIVEGLPQAGEDPKLVDLYNSQFKIMGAQDIKKMRSNTLFMYGMPSVMTDGRLIVKKEEMDKDPRMIGYAMIKEIVYANMGVITYLLDIKV
jgi:aspartate carbamoyltransferase catalytic subunit